MKTKVKPKIALICPADFTVVLCCKWIILNLKEMGHEIIVISPVSENKFFYKEMKKFKVKHIKIKMNRHINPIADLIYLFSLIKILKRNKIKSVFTVCTKPNIYGPIAAKICSIENIYTSVWGRGTVFIERKNFKSKILKFIVLKMYQLSFKISKKVWFTNPNDKRYFTSKNILDSNKIILTNNYIDSDLYKPKKLSKELKEKLYKEFSINKETIVIILVGRMIWSKGIKEFVEAGRILYRKYSNLKLLLVGAEESMNPDSVPRYYLDELSKLNYIKWTQFRNDVPFLYAISKIAVLPSYYKEGGYPRAVTEPMSMEIPVIAGDTEDCRGPIENNKNGLLVKIKDHHDLANKLEILINDHKFAKEISKEARKTIIKKFDEQIIIKKLLKQIY